MNPRDRDSESRKISSLVCVFKPFAFKTNLKNRKNQKESAGFSKMYNLRKAFLKELRLPLIGSTHLCGKHLLSKKFDVLEVFCC